MALRSELSEGGRTQLAAAAAGRKKKKKEAEETRRRNRRTRQGLGWQERGGR